MQDKAHQKPQTTWLDVQKAWFIPAEQLGVMEHIVHEAIADSSKRKRQAALRNVMQVLKGLRLLDIKGMPAGIAFGCTDTGQRGLFIMSSISTQLRNAPLPSNGNYAQERKEASLPRKEQD